MDNVASGKPFELGNGDEAPEIASGDEAAPVTTPVAIPAPAEDEGAEARQSPRYTLLIRAAKLVSTHGEFVCVLRDVSATGVSGRLFHAAPTGEELELHMPGGGVYPLKNVWERDNEAGYQFTKEIDVNRLIHESGEYPKRGLRIGVFFPITIKTITQSAEAVVENLSQQGARFECDGMFAIDQSLRIECAESGLTLKEVRAKVRWRRGQHYGVVFDDTLTLGDFARFVALVQCPNLVEM